MGSGCTQLSLHISGLHYYCIVSLDVLTSNFVWSLVVPFPTCLYVNMSNTHLDQLIDSYQKPINFLLLCICCLLHHSHVSCHRDLCKCLMFLFMVFDLRQSSPQPPKPCKCIISFSPKGVESKLRPIAECEPVTFWVEFSFMVQGCGSQEH